MVLPLNIPGEDICLASCSTVCLYHWFQGMLWQNHEYGVIQLNVYLQICFLLLAVWLGCLGKDDTVQHILWCSGNSRQLPTALEGYIFNQSDISHPGSLVMYVSLSNWVLMGWTFTWTQRKQSEPVVPPPGGAGVKGRLPLPGPTRIFKISTSLFQLAPIVLPEGGEATFAATLPAEPWKQELPAAGH